MQIIKQNSRLIFTTAVFAALSLLLPLVGADSLTFAGISLSPVPVLAGACLTRRRGVGALLGAMQGLGLLLRGDGGHLAELLPMILTGYVAAAAMNGFLRVTGDETSLARCSAAFAAVLAAHFCWGALPAIMKIVMLSAGSGVASWKDAIGQIFSHTVNEGNLIELLLCEAAALPLCARPAPRDGGAPTVMQMFSRLLLLIMCVLLVLLTYGVYFLQSYATVRSAQKTLEINLDDIELEIERAQATGEDIKIVTWRWRIGSTGWAAILKDGRLISAPNSDMLGRTVTEAGWGGRLYIDLPGDAGIGSFNGVLAMYAGREYLDFRLLCFMPMDEVFEQRNIICAALAMGLGALCLFIYLIVAFLCKRVIIEDIDRVNRTLADITAGKLSARVDVEDTQEFQTLSRDINATTDALRAVTEAEKARISEELACAREVQLSALPAPLPPDPAFALSALVRPAEMVGGDFYDFYCIDEGCLAVLVADVCEKGIPAALYMMRAKTAIKELLASGMPPDKAVEAANARLCEQNAPGMFVTLWLGVLELKSGVLTCVDAGHNPPLLLKKNGEPQWLKTLSGLFLGSFQKAEYRSFTLRLEAGDTLLLYTDGVNECQNSKEEFYGNGRLLEFAASHSRVDPEELLSSLLADVDAFADGARQSDDITLLCLRYNGHA